MTLSRISAEQIRRAWADVENLRSIEDAGASVGLSRMQFYRRAKELGLGPRPHANAAVRPSKRPLFEAMWRDGVSLVEIGKVFSIHHMTVSTLAKQYGLPRRKLGGGQVCMKVTQWYEAQIVRAMARAARIEQAAMINAELVDRVGSNVMVGARHARGMA